MPAISLASSLAAPLTSLAAWLATYLAHSTVLLLAAGWLARRVARPHQRANLLRAALWAGIATATLQVAIGSGPDLGSWIRGLERSTPEPARGTLSAPLHADVSGSESRRAAALKEPPAQPAPPLEASGFEAVAPAGALENPAMGPALAPGLSFAALAGVAWLIVALALVLRLVWQSLRLPAYIGPRQPVMDGPWREALLSVAPSSGRSRVRLSMAPGLASPIVLGRREICIPERANRLDADERVALLAHEMAHIERHDPRHLFLAHAVERALFIQPLNRWIRRSMQRETEVACDAWAVERTGRHVALARCLSRIAEWIEDGPSLPAQTPAMAGRSSDLVRRVECILAPRARASGLRARLSVAGFLLTAAALATAGPRVGAQDPEPAFGPRDGTPTGPAQNPASEPAPEARSSSRPTSRPAARPTSRPSAQDPNGPIGLGGGLGAPAVGGAGQGPAAQSPTSRPVSGPAPEASRSAPLAADYRLRVGDQLKLVFAGGLELTLLETVQPQGDLLLPDVGLVEVAGQTRDRARQLIQEQFDRYYASVDVHVQIVGEEPHYLVSGAVALLGKQRLTGQTTLLSAVLEAQPRTATANLGRVRLIRPDPRDPLVIEVDVQRMLETGDTTLNVLLETGDILYVPGRVSGPPTVPTAGPPVSGVDFEVRLHVTTEFPADGRAGSGRRAIAYQVVRNGAIIPCPPVDERTRDEWLLTWVMQLRLDQLQVDPRSKGPTCRIVADPGVAMKERNEAKRALTAAGAVVVESRTDNPERR